MHRDPDQLLDHMQRWVDAGALRPLDLALTRFLHQQAPESDAAVLLAAALTSERNGHGHVCLDLKGTLERPEGLLSRLRDDVEIAAEVRAELSDCLAGLTLAHWVERLAASATVCDRLSGADDDRASPLVLHGSAERPLLYLRRYWAYEQRILTGITERLGLTLSIPEDRLRAQLQALFRDSAAHAGSDAGSDDGDWQQIACALAARSAFAIITGGPGTGKTTTVVRLLALLQGLALDQDQPALRIHLAAPTGKAAARLNESIAGRVASLRLDHLPNGEAVRAAIPTEVTTLHRLLGARPDSRHFRHGPGNPLPADLVVIDEASMVDVEMMAYLLAALRPDARLILLGDKDQLASVEAGAVLGELCQRAARSFYTQATRDWIHRVTGQILAQAAPDDEGTPLDQAIAMLRKSYRFRAEGGIGALAALVNADPVDADSADADLARQQPRSGRLAAVLELFDRHRSVGDQPMGRIQAIRVQDADDPALAELVREGYRAYLSRIQTQHPDDEADQEALDAWGREIVEAHGRFQLLTPLRQGPWGVDGLNRRIIDILAAAALLPAIGEYGQTNSGRQWFAGRPVLVTRNDYQLNLMNGDIGITLAVPVRQHDGHLRRVLRVAFPAGDGSDRIRWILPSRLQAVETVFAMTVHKSQGSEFTHTALILPDRPNPVLTRELLYTGITRSKDAFTLVYSDQDVLGHALEQRVQRVSGIRVSGALDR